MCLRVVVHMCDWGGGLLKGHLPPPSSALPQVQCWWLLDVRAFRDNLLVAIGAGPVAVTVVTTVQTGCHRQCRQL